MYLCEGSRRTEREKRREGSRGRGERGDEEEKGRRKDRRGEEGRGVGGEGRRGGGRLRERRGEDKVGKEKKEQVIPHIQHAVYMYTVHFYALKHGATAIKLAGTKPLGWLSPWG